MDSSIVFLKKLSWTSLWTFVLSMVLGCNGDPFQNNMDDHIVGQLPSELTVVARVDSSSDEFVYMYDKRVQLIHKFNLNQMKHLFALKPLYASQSHFLLNPPSGNYLIDMTSTNISIYDHLGQGVHQPVQLRGVIKSIAYDFDQGYLIVHDFNSATSFLKLDPNGHVVDSWTAGPVLGDSRSLLAGDLNSRGELILALSDRKIAIVQVEESLSEKKWIFTETASPMEKDILWVGMTNEHPESVLIRGRSQAMLFNIDTGEILDQIEIDLSTQSLLKASKSNVPHFAILDSSESHGKLTLYYVNGTTIGTKSLVRETKPLLFSLLDATTDRWTFIEGPLPDNDDQSVKTVDDILSGRSLHRYRYSDFLSLADLSIENETLTRLSSEHLYLLYPSRLGLLKRVGLEGSPPTEVRGFNFPYLE